MLPEGSDIRLVIASFRDITDLLNGFAATTLPDWLDTQPTEQQLRMAEIYLDVAEILVDNMSRLVAHKIETTTT